MKTHVVERKIMWGDLDSLGIVFYPRYYEWIDACGHLFFEAIGLHMGDLRRDRKLAFGLAGTSCRYFKPGRYHQQIRIATTIGAIGEKTVLLNHAIRLSSDESLLMEGSEERICLDVSDADCFRAVRIPEDIYAILKAAAE